jgi:uroporphyrinogen III methyltransferase/synthase
MSVKKVPIYQAIASRTLKHDAQEAFQEPFDFVTVTSASCVQHVCEALVASGKRSRFARLPFASIGPVTSQAVRDHGGAVRVEAKSSTIEGLIDAMVALALTGACGHVR